MAGGMFSGAKLNGMTIRESATDGSDFTNPDADYRRLFLGEDGGLHLKDSAGSVTAVGGGGGDVATDAIWDAAGDLAVGTGANTAGKLAVGAAGGALSVINSAVAWNSGTSMPANKATGDRYWRTDLGLEFYWDGTRWVSTTLYRLELPFYGQQVVSADAVMMYGASWSNDFDLWLVKGYFDVGVGPTNDGSKYWTFEIYKQVTGGGADASLGSANTAGLTANQKHQLSFNIGAAAGATTAVFYSFATKVSTATNVVSGAGAMTYRLIGT